MISRGSFCKNTLHNRSNTLVMNKISSKKEGDFVDNNAEGRISKRVRIRG